MKIVILPGSWNKVHEHVKGALDFRKAVKNVLLDMNVAIADPCCPTPSAVQPLGVLNGELVTYDAETKEWVPFELP